MTDPTSEKAEAYVFPPSLLDPPQQEELAAQVLNLLSPSALARVLEPFKPKPTESIGALRARRDEAFYTSSREVLKEVCDDAINLAAQLQTELAALKPRGDGMKPWWR